MKTYSGKRPGEQQEVINDLCRLCMAKKEVLVPIFSDDGAVPLTLKIMACVALEVFEGDGLPSKICHPCKKQVDKSYMFRKKCEHSDQKLRDLRDKLADADNAIGMDASASEKIHMENSSESYDLNEKKVSTERDLVGVKQVTIIQPEACTLSAMPMKREVVEGQSERMFLVKDDVEMVKLEYLQDGLTVIENKDVDAIPKAAEDILVMHPNIDFSGSAIQVEVTMEDGSVTIMELTSEDADPRDLAMPVEVNKKGELKVFRCTDCPKSFARPEQLRRHATVHMLQHGISCGVCEKWFPTRSAFVRHERTHTGERPFSCEVCHKSFAQKQILSRHLMTHTGLKLYNCSHCSKDFASKESLRVHLKSHLNFNPWDIELHHCTLCPKLFCYASGLSRHLVTHTGKTFKCCHCDKSFTDKSSLRRHHRQTNHKE